jgi:aspartate-semialdehyde dehydrogenase
VGSISKRFSPAAVKAGAIVVDNSAAFRLEDWVPLVVPEVNPEDVVQHRGIIANPNCSTIQMVVALNPIHKVNPIKRIVVDTYQSVSGTGKDAVEELKSQSALTAEGRSDEIKPWVYPNQIAFNLFPHIDVWMPDGSCREEWKMVRETKKIMHLPEVRMAVTTVRVPVFFAHSEAVHIELTHPMTPEEARAVLREAPGVVVQDDTANNVYPMPLPAQGHNETYVGRVRANEAFDNGLSLWVVADNIRKGAATNAVQIAEVLAAKNQL